MKNFMHFYEQIIKKILHMIINVDISHSLGHLIYKYYIILSFKVMDHIMGLMNKYIIIKNWDIKVYISNQITNFNLHTWHVRSIDMT